MLASWLGNALYVFGLIPVPGLDPTPPFLLLAGGAMVLAVGRFGLLDVALVARSAVVEGMEDGVIMLDSLGRVLDMNPAVRRLCRLPASEAVGRPVEEVVSSPEILRAIRDGQEGGRRQVRVADGDARRDYEVTVSAPRESRRTVRFVVVHDVTERIGRDLLFRLIVENASDIVSIYEPGAGLRYVSPSVERILGYAPEEAASMGRSVLEARKVTHPKDVLKMAVGFARVLKTSGINPPVEFRMRHKDGSWRHMEGVFNNLLKDPEVHGVVSVWRDVTGRVEAEEEVRRLNAELEDRVEERTRDLKESEERYRAIFENAVEGIFQTAADGRLVTANPAMARIFGYGSPGELLSSVTDGQLYARPERRAQSEEVMRERGEVAGFEAEIRRRDGSTG